MIGAGSFTKLSTVKAYEVDREFSKVGRRIMFLNASKVFYETGTQTTILLEFEDVTSQRAIELQVQESQHEKEMLLEEMERRVANSLQIIASILLIKAQTATGAQNRAISPKISSWPGP